ncbi:MAG TPA: hypothetical protein VEY11_06720 [Pyrinomonadaceae bacterium]|nr:hypothetical protein [Pyrinomonadaceae bacterium]
MSRMRKQEEAAGDVGEAFGGACEFAPGLAPVAAAAPAPDAFKLRAASQSAAPDFVERLPIAREVSPASREREAPM